MILANYDLDQLYEVVSDEIGVEESVAFTAEKDSSHFSGVEIILSIAGICITTFLSGFLEEPMKNAGKKSWLNLRNILSKGLEMRYKEQKKDINDILKDFDVNKYKEQTRKELEIHIQKGVLNLKQLLIDKGINEKPAEEKSRKIEKLILKELGIEHE